MKKRNDLTYKYVDTNKIFTKVSEMLKKQNIQVSDSMIESIFKFQFDEVHRQMKNKEYISLPKLGSFGIQIWKDTLEEERLLFCVKNHKGDLAKNSFRMSNSVIDHNWLIYNEARSLHTTYNDVEIYKKEIYHLFNKLKDNIITRELLIDAYYKGSNSAKTKVENLLKSTEDIATSWYINKKDRKRKIEYHNIEGFVSYRDRKIAENRNL